MIKVRLHEIKRNSVSYISPPHLTLSFPILFVMFSYIYPPACDCYYRLFFRNAIKRGFFHTGSLLSILYTCGFSSRDE